MFVALSSIAFQVRRQEIQKVTYLLTYPRTYHLYAVSCNIRNLKEVEQTNLIKSVKKVFRNFKGRQLPKNFCIPSLWIQDFKIFSSDLMF